MPFETSAGLIARIFAVFRKDQKLADKAQKPEVYSIAAIRRRINEKQFLRRFSD